MERWSGLLLRYTQQHFRVEITKESPLPLKHCHSTNFFTKFAKMATGGANRNNDESWKKQNATIKPGHVKVIFVNLVATGKQWDEDLSHLLENSQLQGEINLGCGSWKKGEFKFFKAHKTLLEKRSEYCRKTFEDVGEQDKPYFVFEKIQPKIMRKMLDFIYTGNITLNRNEELDCFMEAASQLEVSEVHPQREYYSYVPEDGGGSGSPSANSPEEESRGQGNGQQVDIIRDRRTREQNRAEAARQVWLTRSIALNSIFVSDDEDFGGEFGLL